MKKSSKRFLMYCIRCAIDDKRKAQRIIEGCSINSDALNEWAERVTRTPLKTLATKHLHNIKLVMNGERSEELQNDLSYHISTAEAIKLWESMNPS